MKNIDIASAIRTWKTKEGCCNDVFVYTQVGVIGHVFRLSQNDVQSIRKCLDGSSNEDFLLEDHSGAYLRIKRNKGGNLECRTKRDHYDETKFIIPMNIADQFSKDLFSLQN